MDLRSRMAAVALATLTIALTSGSEAMAREEDGGSKHSPYYVVMDPPIVYPGAVIRLQVRPPAGATSGTVTVAGRRYLGEIEDGMFVAYFAVDIDTLPGPYELQYDVGSRSGTRIVTVRARRMDEEGRGADRSLSKEDQIMEELVRTNPRLLSLFNRTTLERYWTGAFQSPTSGSMTATFAMRKASEESLGLPHTGVDLAARGEVVAAGVGSVALVADGPSNLKLVVLDHGFGLYTYYFGLGEVAVDEGQWLRRGAVLGTMPGRGALHFGARLAGAEVDPVSLPGINLKVPAISGERRAPKEEKDKTSDYDF